jgi:GxxExxY protein
MVEESHVRNAAEFIVRELGAGFTERIYHTAMETYLTQTGTPFKSEQEIPVTFLNQVVGSVRADLVVNNNLVVELRVTNNVSDNHTTQCNMYMKLLNIKNGLVINFPKSENEMVYFEKVSLNTPTNNGSYRCGREGHSQIIVLREHM